MVRVSRFSDEQKLEIAMDLIAGKMSHVEICRKWDISSTYAYKLKDRALDYATPKEIAVGEMHLIAA